MEQRAQLEALVAGTWLELLWPVPYLLSRAGFSVDVITTSPVMRASKFVRSVSEVKSPEDLATLVYNRICGRAKPYDWVIAADDDTLRALSGLTWPPGLRPRLLPALSDGEYPHLYSKIGLSRVLQAGGIKTPAFEVAESCEQAVSAANRLGYPVMAKIDSSSGGRGVYECLCDADVRALEPMFASRAMLIQKKIIGAELDLSAIYFDRQLVHFTYSIVERNVSRFGPSSVRTYYPLQLVGAEEFQELAALGRALGANGFVNVHCIRAADGSGRYYIEADMRPNVWIDYSIYYGVDAADRVRDWFTARVCLSRESIGPCAGCSPIKIPYFLRLRLWELLVNRYRVWRFIPFADTRVVLSMLVTTYIRPLLKSLIPGKIKRAFKSMLTTTGVPIE
jgi:hypothetical protein